jgi:phenylpropionate dioxygenase-like ring-hydroxylating dioxygenase large terminal subunit
VHINFWYPICTGEELQDKPLRVTLFGLRFAAFRDSSGAANVLADTCIHRGGSLSKGWIKDDCLVCPYHGWEYQGNGACATIPSQKKGKPPARAKVDSYPVVERYGIVFAFLGDLPENERPPMYEIPQLGQEGWRASKPMVNEIGCYMERAIENGLDPFHNEFVHPSQGKPQLIDGSMEIEEFPYGTKFMARFGEIDDKLTGLNELRSDPAQLKAGSWYYGPNTLVTDIQFNGVNNFIQYAFEAPIDETNTRTYLVNLRNCMLDPELDEQVAKINQKVALEDFAILENLWPIRTPDSTNKELLTEGDVILVRYREHLEEWRQKGWQIDRKALREAGCDTAYAIPCPGRRTSGNWILDPVPLLTSANS